MSESAYPPNWVVVYVDPDAMGDGQGGKDASTSFYPVQDSDQAEQLAKLITEYEYARVYDAGGYPGYAYVMDLNDPNSYDDPMATVEMIAEIAAEHFYSDRINEGASEENAQKGADSLYAAVTQRYAENDEGREDT